MMRACITSGCKGGTGKSTLSTLLTILYAGVGKRVVLIDTGSNGNSSHIVLNNPPPPYLRDVLLSENILDAVIKCEIAIKNNVVDFYLIPNNGQIPRIPKENIKRSLKELERFFDIAILDIPAYQNSEYDVFIEQCDIAVLVYNPNQLVLKSVSRAYTGKCEVIPVLNKYFGVEKYRRYVEKIHGKCLTIPFDPYLSILCSENLVNVLLNVSSKTQESLVKLALEIVAARNKSERPKSRNFPRINTILRR